MEASLVPATPELPSDDVPSLQATEQGTPKRGKLKIFLGMCAGVGKTYAMLQEARDRASEGEEIVVGYVNTHYRAETEVLLEGLPVVAMKETEERGKTYREVDIDEILRRKPALTLIDELAHTNTKHCRHAKRFQDVQELLAHGIDVYTTLNVFEVESRTDTAHQITGVEIGCTVPDSVVEEADAIELVDISPDELLERLHEGNIYPEFTAEQNEEQAGTFFRKGNLTALREMALRLAAERVDQELRDYKQEQHIETTWKTGERLMVAVSPSPFSEPLVRWTRRMAYTMDASWIALSVETSKPLPPEAQSRVTKHLDLARELGAEILSTTDDDIVDAILRVARRENVSQIVVGKPPKQSLWQRFRNAFSGGNVVDRLIQESGTIDVYVVRVEPSKETIAQEPPSVVPEVRSGFGQYLITLELTALVGFICFIAYSAKAISYETVGIVLIFSSMLMALRFGRGPVVIASLVSALFWNYFFIPPQFTFEIAKIEDALLFGLYMTMAIIAGTLTSRVRIQERAVRMREERASVLQTLAKDLSGAVTKDDVLNVAMQNIEDTFNADTAIFLPKDKDSDHSSILPELDPNALRLSSFKPNLREAQAAVWVFQNKKHAGRFTETLPGSEGYYLPMISPRGIIGVMGLKFNAQNTPLTIDQQTLLESFVSQTASALEREMLNAEAKEAEFAAESERLTTTLLNTIAADLRSPLSAMNEAASALADGDTAANPELRVALNREIQDATTRMNRLVDNLIMMTNLESGNVQVSEDWCDVEELIQCVVKRLADELQQHTVLVSIPEAFPLVKMDEVLMEQVLLKLIHNAALYTPPQSRIDIEVKRTATSLLIMLADNGPGVPPHLVPRLFEKFYRLTPDGSGATEIRIGEVSTGGTGLGLSIAKGLVELQQGSIKAELRPKEQGGGLQFTIALPLVQTPNPHTTTAAPDEATAESAEEGEPTTVGSAN
jgi:two-component system sensor histidine kinase KdpD